MPAPARHPAATRLLVLAIAAMLLLAGCGAQEPEGRTAATTSEPAARDRAATTPAVDADDEDAVVAPTPAARAADARYAALLRAYAPVTQRINFLVTAETLRSDAVSASAGDKLERERFGAVRIELRRMERILRKARAKVAEAKATPAAQEHVRELMLEAIDARLRALGQLELALDAQRAKETPASEVERLDEQWHASWDESLRAAREATTAMQESRALLGLEPAAEDGIR